MGTRALGCEARTERIERLSQQAQYLRRIGGGQRAAAMGFAQIVERAAACRRRVERPAEMFARMAQAQFDAVEAKHFAIERAGERKLFAKRRRESTLACRQIARELSWKPGFSLRARPTITASAPDAASAASASSTLSMSPLTTTGSDTASFTARTAAQSARAL